MNTGSLPVSSAQNEAQIFNKGKRLRLPIGIPTTRQITAAQRVEAVLNQGKRLGFPIGTGPLKGVTPDELRKALKSEVKLVEDLNNYVPGGNNETFRLIRKEDKARDRFVSADHGEPSARERVISDSGTIFRDTSAATFETPSHKVKLGMGGESINTAMETEGAFQSPLASYDRTEPTSEMSLGTLYPFAVKPDIPTDEGADEGGFQSNITGGEHFINQSFKGDSLQSTRYKPVRGPTPRKKSGTMLSPRPRFSPSHTRSNRQYGIQNTPAQPLGSFA